jgi:Xaa-Pro aminopeptidase
MSAAEIAWLDAYHAGVREKLASSLDGETRAWLEDATRTIG